MVQDPARWPGGAKIAVAINVMYEQWSDGVAPGIGPMGNPLRSGIDHQALSWAAFGPKTGVWNLLDLLDERRTRASFYASGILADSAADSLAAIARAGHELCGHSWAQDLIPTMMSTADELAMIRRCTQRLQEASGQRPIGWISPRCTPSAVTAELLAGEGYSWFGDVFDSDLPYALDTPGGAITALPFSLDVNDLPMTVRYGRPIGALVSDFEYAIAARRALPTRSLLDVTVHAHVAGRPGGLLAVREILALLAGSQDCWVATRAEIAAEWRESTPGTEEE